MTAPAGNRAYPQANRFATAGPGSGTTPGPGTTPGGGADRGASLAERGYVHARFGGLPVLIGPELAAQLKASREQQP
jgi:hypothetical protein